MIIVEEGKIRLRELNDNDSDYALLAKWLSNEKVLEYYEGRDKKFDLTKVKEKFGPRIEHKDGITACILEYENKPIGYMQFYKLTKESSSVYKIEHKQGTYGIDMFIGETLFWGKGIGSRVLKILAEFLLKDRAKQVIIDPYTWNKRAIRAYEKAGFEKVHTFTSDERHEGKYYDCWLMRFKLI